jgi:hypothetical protein
MTQAKPVCALCLGTGAMDYSHFAMDPCPCSDGDWPDAPHPHSPLAPAPADSPTGRTLGTTAPAPDTSGPGQPCEGNAR